MMPMVARYETHADGFIPARSHRVLLSRDFIGKRLIHWTPTVTLDVAEQSCRAVPLVVPARIVSYRVEADPFDRNAGLPRPRWPAGSDRGAWRGRVAAGALRCGYSISQAARARARAFTLTLTLTLGN